LVTAVNTTVAGTTTFYVTQTVKGCQSPATPVTVTVSAPIAFNLSKTDLTGCAADDGTITVSGVTGGTGSYQYRLNGSTYQNGATFTGLGAGNHTVYVKDDNQCVATRSIELTAPGGFTATVTPANETGCDVFDGIIRVTGLPLLPAGAGEYTFYRDGVANWEGSDNPTFTGLQPGTYTITVQAPAALDSCTFTTVATVGTDCVQGCVITASLAGKTDPSCPVKTTAA
jgi:hypothetical protein